MGGERGVNKKKEVSEVQSVGTEGQTRVRREGTGKGGDFGVEKVTSLSSTRCRNKLQY